MTKIHQYTMLCAPVLSQKAAVEALADHHRDVSDMKAAYEKRRNYIHAALNEMGLQCHLPGGAFYVFPRISHCGLSSADFALRLLDEEKVACVPGTAFGAPGYMRLSFACSMEMLEEALNRIKRVLMA